ncbi:CD209 antigen-like protein B [Danio aesculapii]|uniref:CD209 antigen-like protein B n=1 Tax=Danio aesculapii TaxID=1142201 RepID=UPI0024BFBFF6|nr:CD209 antigen-like protein B [Danio aesculapii]
MRKIIFLVFISSATVHLTEAEEAPLKQDEDFLEPDSVLLEPETTEEYKHTEEASVLLEEPELNADYLTEEAPETDLQSKTLLNTNLKPVEEPVDEPVEEPVEFQSEVHMQVESENVLKEEPTLQADYIVVEEPEVEMNPPGRKQRTALQKGRRHCRGFTIQYTCYEFFTRKLNARDAELQCQKVCPNGHLASVTSSFIRAEIYNLMDRYGSRSDTWLGGRRIIGTNTFTWLDGEPWTYNGFFSGEPNNLGGNEDCIEILYRVGFNDVACFLTRPFVCSCPV